MFGSTCCSVKVFVEVAPVEVAVEALDRASLEGVWRP
ncbi:hypothetical protein FrEUN1fDRAFT_5122 [Parafrankia sp. EUN1f]|nr:hypothetical protein FrEUN1fDRAFT_5122 [Parafrankia sp. EUN1f]